MVHKLDFQMRHYASLQRLVALNITIKEQHLSYKTGSIPISCKQKSWITILLILPYYCFYYINCWKLVSCLCQKGQSNSKCSFEDLVELSLSFKCWNFWKLNTPTYSKLLRKKKLLMLHEKLPWQYMSSGSYMIIFYC